MDAQLRKEIMDVVKATVKATIKEVLPTILAEAKIKHDDQYLTTDKLMEQFGMFSKSWLEKNAWRMVRVRSKYEDEDGPLYTRYAYSLEDILQHLETTATTNKKIQL